MVETKKTTKQEETVKTDAVQVEVAPQNNEPRGGGRNDNKRNTDNRRRRGGSGKRDNNNSDREFDQVIIDLARVTRVMAGGKRMRFRACVAIGNHQGKIGLGLAKGADVTMAMNKAVNQAKKNMIEVHLTNGTIPHTIRQKYGAGSILLKPAKPGRGVICGGVMRLVVEMAGIHNITGKILGTNNKVTNAKTVMLALQNLKAPKKSNKSAKNAVKVEPIKSAEEVK
ncbi:MAG: 30S ribosomal protein S5 [bacterium]